MFGPAGGDIRAIQRVGEHAEEGAAAVGDGVGFEEAGAGFIPLVGFDGDLVAEKSSWFGGCASSFFVVGADRLEEAVDGRGRDPEQRVGNFRRDVSKGPDISG